MSKALKVDEMQDGVWYRHAETKQEMLFQVQEYEEELIALSGKIKKVTRKSNVMLSNGFLGQMNIWGQPKDGEFELCQD